MMGGSAGIRGVSRNIHGHFKPKVLEKPHEYCVNANQASIRCAIFAARATNRST
jgi:hypothetical protein